MNPSRLLIIGCPVFRRELELLTSQAGPQVTIQWLDMGLHQRSAVSLHQALQAAIDENSRSRFDSIALAYGLCNRGVAGLQARSVPVVIPRAHDCIGLLLGSNQSYLAQLESRPGTYFQSPGWLDNAPESAAVRQPDFTFGPTGNVTREELARRYGEENADYLLEQLKGLTRHYERLAYISMPVPNGSQWRQQALRLARKMGWKFEPLQGDLGWLRRLVQGDWNEREFLTLQPGQRVVLRSDASLFGSQPA